MTATMRRDARTKELIAELDLLRQLKRLEDALRAVSEAQTVLADRIDSLADSLVTTATTDDDGRCPTCNEPMAYYHGPGTDSGRICTYCDDGVAWSYDDNWDNPQDAA